jgi:two-component system sensor histidine kinase YesM
MMSEITTLRIKGYEQRLMAEKAQMDALRMQIRPHFFLNCLKSIFGLAQAGKTEEIKKTVLW